MSLKRCGSSPLAVLRPRGNQSQPGQSPPHRRAGWRGVGDLGRGRGGGALTCRANTARREHLGGETDKNMHHCVFLSINFYMQVYRSNCPPVYLCIHPPIRLDTHLHVCLCAFVYTTVNSPVCLSVWTAVYLSVRVDTCLSICAFHRPDNSI